METVKWKIQFNAEKLKERERVKLNLNHPRLRYSDLYKFFSFTFLNSQEKKSGKKYKRIENERKVLHLHMKITQLLFQLCCIEF